MFNFIFALQGFIFGFSNEGDMFNRTFISADFNKVQVGPVWCRFIPTRPSFMGPLPNLNERIIIRWPYSIINIRNDFCLGYNVSPNSVSLDLGAINLYVRSPF